MVWQVSFGSSLTSFQDTLQPLACCLWSPTSQGSQESTMLERRRDKPAVMMQEERQTPQ